MKKVVFSVAIICLVLVLPKCSIAAGNLIGNPSVEQKTGPGPTDWLRTKKGNNVSVFAYKTDGYGGGKSLYINVTKYITGESYWYFKDVPVVPNATYTYSEYYKSSMSTKLYARVRTAAGVETTIFLKDVPAASAWTEVSAEIATPSDAQLITVYHAASALGFLQTDNFSLNEKIVVPQPEPPIDPPPPQGSPDNPIPNPSVEEVSDSVPTLPAHWTKVKTGNNNAVFTYQNTGHTGERSLKVAITRYTSGLAYFAFDTAPVTGGTTYDYSFFQKSDVYTEVDAAITLSSGEVVYQYLGVTFPSSDWTKFSTRIRMPEGAVHVSIYNMLYSKGYLVSDDFALTPVQVVPLARPLVSVTFDDFFDALYDTVYPMMQEHGFAGTAYLLSQDLGKSETLTPDKIIEMSHHGFEIGGHTVTHAHLPFITPQEVDYELAQSKTDIAAFTGITPINFASPYGEYNDAVKEQIKQQYRSHRSVDVGYNTKDNFDMYNIKAMSTINTTTPETVLEWVDAAIADRGWLVLVYHDIIDNGATFTNTPAHLQAVLDGIASRGVTVKTVDKALDEIVPQI